MSPHHNTSFLPSGAVNMLPFDFPQYLLSSGNTPATTTIAHHNNGPPSSIFQPYTAMSPPKTRSGSVEDNNAILTEDWCAFVQQLRNQFQGERAHYRADRDRIQEVIEGERILWEHERQLWNKERKALKTRIIDLETKLNMASESIMNFNKALSLNFRMPISGSKNLDESATNKITQESGRNADGSPFYAPASRNPTRTFDPEIASDLRVDDLSAPQETAIRVTSKELTSSDFIQQKISSTLTTDISQETIPEAIDISHIQPELDGVAIRVSAVSPTFAAKVILPHSAPSSTSSPTELKIDSSHRTNMKTESCLKIHGPASFTQQENRRLTLFAGHTPNHSVSKFEFLESGSITPAQAPTSDPKDTESIEIEAHELKNQEPDGLCTDESDECEEELSEPLGLVNISGPDNFFLAQLTEKLAEEVRKSESLNSPSDSELTHIDPSESLQPSSHADKPGGPLLKMRPSMNFGKPFGSI